MRSRRARPAWGAVTLAVVAIATTGGAALAQSPGQTRIVTQEDGTRLDTLNDMQSQVNASTGVTTILRRQDTIRLYQERTDQWQQVGSHTEYVPDSAFSVPGPIGSWEQAGYAAISVLQQAAAAGYSYNPGASPDPLGRGWWAANVHDGSAMGQYPPGQIAEAWNVVADAIRANGWSPGDPVMLDLEGKGSIAVTGRSSAKIRNKANDVFVAEGAVKFDLFGSGPVKTEWVRPGVGILVDNRQDAARKRVESGENLTIYQLLGDSNGHLSGFSKLSRLFPVTKVAKGVALKGEALNDLLVWKDNGDGVCQAEELVTLSSLGITELQLPAKRVTKDGEVFEQASFVKDGKQSLMQEVWFQTEGTRINYAALPSRPAPKVLKPKAVKPAKSRKEA